jgi:Acetyl xylan esterase (AXE1)
MLHILIVYLSLISNISQSSISHQSDQLIFKTERTDSLPRILAENHGDLIAGKLRLDAILKFAEHKLPDNLKDWEIYRIQLKNEIIKKAGVVFDHELPLNIKETGKIQMTGYSVKNIAFQTRPGIYATANLYIPDGNGPFPAVVHMLGHWTKGKIDSTGPQAVGHSLASNGYVCLTIDPWGSGERTTIHGIFEDHGDENSLGSSLMNIGETMMGVEISDNIRGVDLLCSLPYVDSKNIGATGASGGGNQTMWLASLDERIKAAMLVVSAGTFESHIMGSPCICEVMADALNFTEEAGVLALVAPRAIKMCNHKKDDIPAFLPSEMVRSYNSAKPVFKMYGVENNITYQLFDLPHGYMSEDREALLGWFDLHLKGIGKGASRKETPFKQLPEEKLMVFPKGQRDADVVSTVEYCKDKGSTLRTVFLNSVSIDNGLKRNELRDILGISEVSILKDVHKYSKMHGWDRLVLETSDNKLIPLMIYDPSANSNEFVIVVNPEGKDNITPDLLDEIIKSGQGIAIVDLSGTGEASSASAGSSYRWGKLRTISRSELWFGRTIIGEWVKELNVISQFLNSDYKAHKVTIDGSKEAGLAGLFLGALGDNVDSLILRKAPVSYLFDIRKGIDFFSMGIHLPGFLKWGDVSLAAALSSKNVLFINPVSMSGNAVSKEKLPAVEAEFEKIRTLCHQPGKTVFK